MYKKEDFFKYHSGFELLQGTLTSCTVHNESNVTKRNMEVRMFFVSKVNSVHKQKLFYRYFFMQDSCQIVIKESSFCHLPKILGTGTDRAQFQRKQQGQH